MPLSKTITDTRGVAAAYWVATRGDINLSGTAPGPNGSTITGTTWFAMRGYVSKAQHDTDINSFVIEKPYTVAIDLAAALPAPGSGLFVNVVAYMEALALQQADFADASQVA